MWIFGRKGASGFSASSTAEEVTQGIDGTGLTAIVTGPLFLLLILYFCLDFGIISALYESFLGTFHQKLCNLNAFLLILVN